jgi:tripartite-type tricarboxylate transporter receptor subunit TctC
VVNNSTGGPVDIFARLLAPVIASRIPGSPSAIVENRPGAGGVVGTNYVFNAAAPDGLTIGFLISVAHQGIVDDGSVKFDPGRFRWLGAIPTTQVLLARTDLMISSPIDLLKPAKPLVLAIDGANNVGSMTNRLFLSMIGATYTVVSGYPGQGPANLALARGEVSLNNSNHLFYLSNRENIRKEKIYDAILQRGQLGEDGTLRRNRLLPELPTMLEAAAQIKPASVGSIEAVAYRTIAGALAVQFGIVLPPRADDAVTTTMATAVADALSDPETKRMVLTKTKSDYDFVDGRTAQKIVERLRADHRADSRIGEIAKKLAAGN